MTQDQFEKIEAYLDQRLDKAEQAQFEDQLERDPSLGEEVEQQRSLRESIALEGARQILSEVMEKQERSKVFPFQLKRWHFAVAASILLIGLTWYWVAPKQPLEEQLYAQNFVVAPGLPTTLGLSTEPAFAEGMVAYQQGNYQGSIDYWQPLIEEIPSDTLQFYFAMALLAKENAAAAKPYLAEVLKDSSSTFRADARWYLALIYLKQEQQKMALEQLDYLTEHPSYAPRVKEIMKELEGK